MSLRLIKPRLARLPACSDRGGVRTSRRATPVGLAAWLVLGGSAWALPTGEQFVSGQVQVSRPVAGQMLINQSTANAAIDWQTFSIGAGERVRVQQPGASSVLFSRVQSGDPSLILGQLQANGRVFLSNPSGIIFGANSRVDVAGLVATTLSWATAAAQDGRYSLQRASTAEPAEPGELRADGVINAPGGTVALVSPRLHLGESASISAGRVGLAAVGAVQVDVDGDGLIFFNPRNDQELATRLSLLGNVLATAGSAEARAVARSGFADTVLNLDGVVRARGLGTRGGQVVVDGGPSGLTRVAGRVVVDGERAGQSGGDIHVLGDQVRLTAGAVLSADGAAGGGRVMVGGGWQGQDPALHNARAATVEPGAQISASATGAGDGGRVVVWSDGLTLFDGRITATGHGPGARGGQVETSGKQGLGIHSGQVVADGTGTVGGAWLLDPDSITVVAAGGTSASPGAANGASGDATINAAVLNGLSAATNVDLQATDNITIAAPITRPGGTLTLTTTAPSGGINLNANVSVTDAAVTLTTGTDGISQLAGTTLSSGTGTITFTSTGPVALGGTVSGASLVKQGAGDLTVTTTSPTVAGLINTTTLNLSAGNLITTGSAQLGSGTTLAVTSGTKATVVGAQAITALQLNGELDGAGTLTTSGSATLTSGIVGANLVADSLTSNGSSAINKPTTVTNAALVSSGTLAIGSGGKLTGTTTISSGATLTTPAGLTDALGNASVVTVDGTLTLGDAETIGGLAGAATGRVNLVNAKALTIDRVAGAAPVFLGVVQGGDATSVLRKTGVGVQVLAATQDYDGITRISDGVLQLGDDSAGGALKATAAPVEVAVTGTLRLHSTTGRGAFNFTQTINGAGVDGSGRVEKIGNGVLTLTPTAGNAYAGGTTVSAGTLGISANNQVGTGAITLDGGTLRLAAAGMDLNRSVSVTTGSGTLDTNGGTSTLSQAVTGAGTLTVDGAGSLTLQNAGELRPAALVVASGQTVATPGGTTTALGASTALTVNGTLTLNDNASAASLSLGGTLGGSGRLTTGGSTTLTGGTVSTALTTDSLGATASSSIAAAVTVTNGATVASPAALTVRTTGSLSAASITVDAGASLVTEAGANQVIGDAAALTLNGSLTLGGAETLGTVSGSGAITLANAAELVMGGSTDTVFTGVIGGGNSASSVRKIGSGTLTVASAQTYTGFTQVDEGRLQVGNGATAGSLASSEVRLANGAVLRLDRGLAPAQTVSSNIVNVPGNTTGRLEKTGTGEVLLRGANNFGGGTTVSAGTLDITAGNQVGTGTLTLSNGATLRLAASGQTLANTITLGTGGGTVDTNGQALTTLTGNVGSASGGNFTKAGSGTLALGGSATLAAPTATVSGGTLSTAGSDRIDNGTAVVVSGGAGSVLSIGGNDTVASLSLTGELAGSGVLTTTGLASLNGGTVSTGLAGGSFSSSGTSAITAPVTSSSTAVVAGSLTVSGSGKLSATTGLTVASGATLSTGVSGDAIGDATNLTLDGTLTLGAGEALGQLSGASTGQLTLANGGQLAVGGAADTTFSGVLSGGNGGSTVRKTGSGRLTLSAAQTYIGATLVDAGVLQVGTTTTDGSLASSQVSLANGAVLHLERAGGGAAQVLAASVVDQAGATTGRLVKTGAGELQLRGTNTFSGGTTASAGVVNVDAASRLGSGVLTLDAATLRLAASGLSLPNAITVGNGGATVDTNGQASTTLTSAVATPLAGTGSFSKTGGGMLTLAVGGGLSVPTANITGGTLATAGGNLIGDSTAVVVSGGGSSTLSIGGNDTVTSLQLTGTLAGSGTLTVTNGADLASATVNARLTSASLTNGGSSTLNEQVTVNGSATVAGTLAVGSSGRLSASTLQINNAATLSTAAGNTNALGDATAVTVAGTLTLGDAETIGSLAGGSTGRVNLANGAQLSTGGAADTSFSGVIQGGNATSGLRKRGSGMFTLTNTHTYTGSTQVDAGVLKVGDGATAGVLGSGDVALANGATLRLNVDASSPAQTFNNTIANLAGNTTGRLEKTGSGELRLRGSVGHGGGVLVSGGALNIDTLGRLGSGALTLDGGTLRLGGAGIDLNNTITLGSNGGTVDTAGFSISLLGAVSGSGSFTKTGSGTLTVAAGATLGTNAITVAGGTLATVQPNQVNDSTALTVTGGPTTVLSLGGDDVVASLSLAGTLAGSGQLTTTGLASLNSGTVNTRLSAGSLASSGASTINALVDVTGNATVGGTSLVIGSAGRLSTGAAASTTVSTGATLTTTTGMNNGLGDSSNLVVDGSLVVGGAETVRSLQLNGGSLTGSGSLLASTSATVAGGSVAAGLSTPVFTNSGNSSLTDVVTASSSAAVTGGTLTISGSGRLAGTIGTPVTISLSGGATLATTATAVDGLGNADTVSVASGSTLSLGRAETIGGLALSGTLSGISATGPTLTVSGNATLAGGTVASPLAVGGTLGSSGNSVLAATASSGGTATVSGGLLQVNSGGKLDAANISLTGTGSLAVANGVADGLANGATVAVASGATLTINNTETITNLNLSGAVSGTGLLTVSGTTTLTGGSVGGPLRSGGLVNSGDSSINSSITVDGNTTLGSGTLTITAGGHLSGNAVAVNAGNLATASGATDALDDNANVSVASGATLTIGGPETIAGLTLTGTLAGSGTLTTTNTTLTSGTVAANLVSSALTSSGASSIIAGTSTINGTATVSGGTLGISGSGRLGATLLQVTGGSLSLAAGSGDALADSTVLTVGSAGTVSLAGNETIQRLTLQGTLQGGGRLTTTADTSLAGGTLATPLLADSLASSGLSTINAAATVTNTATVASGTLAIGAGGRLSAPAIVVNAGSLSTAAGVSNANALGDDSAVTVAGGASLAIGSAETIRTLNLAGSLGGSGLLTVSGNTALTGSTLGSALVTSTLTSSGSSTVNAAVTANTSATVSSGSLAIGTAGRLTAPEIVVDAGTLSTAAANTNALGDAALVRVANGATLQVANAELVNRLALSGTLAGSGSLATTLDAALDGGTVSARLASATLTSTGASSLQATTTVSGQATVTSGSLAITGNGQLLAPQVSVAAGSLSTANTGGNGLDNNAAVSVASGATLSLVGNETIGSLALAGNLGGSGILSANSVALTSGIVAAGLQVATLTSSGASTISRVVQASQSAQVSDGTLALQAGGRLATPLLTVANGALAHAQADGTLDGTVALRINTGAELRLDGAQTVSSINLAGRSSGSGLLTTTTAALDGGSAGLAMATGSLTSTGSSTLSATVNASQSAEVQAGSLTVASGGLLSAPRIAVAGGTLATEAGGTRLGTGSALQVDAPGTLQLGSDQSVLGLTLSGRLDGPGALTVANTATVAGGTVATTLHAPAFSSSGNTLVTALLDTGNQFTVTAGTLTLGVGASLSANRVDVTGGTLVASAANQLPAQAEIDVASGATLRLQAEQSASTLTLAGTLDGGSPLSVARASLAGGSVRTALASGTLDSQGSSTIAAATRVSGTATVSGGTLTLDSNGSLGAAVIRVDAGTLASGGAGRLVDTSALVVASGARLQLAGAERAATLDLSGTLAGPGALSVASISRLAGGQVQTALDTAQLVSTGTSQLAAPLVASQNATVDGGVLTLASGGRLSSPLLNLASGNLTTTASGQLDGTQAVVVGTGQSLRLAGAERVTGLQLQGSLDGAGALTTTNSVLQAGTVNARLDTATLDSTGASSLQADVTASSQATVSSGSLLVGANGTLSSPTIVVASDATLRTAAADRLGDASSLQLADRATLVLGGNEAVALLSDALGASAANGGGGSALVDLGSNRLAVGAGNASGRYSGQLTGDGSIDKQGSGAWVLTGANGHGATRISAGTLQLGADGNSGSLGRGAVVNNGVLRVQRSDSFDLAVAITGSGSLQQAGSGTLTLSSSGNAYSGGTEVLSGVLQTGGSQRLPDVGEVKVSAGATLRLAGDEVLGAVSGSGRFELGGSVTTSGDQTYSGPVTVTSATPIVLSAPGQTITAQQAGNDWGSQPLSLQAGRVLLSAGQNGADWRDLTLGQVQLSGSGTSLIEAGRIALGLGTTSSTDARLAGSLSLLAGRLNLTARAAPASHAQLADDPAAVDPLSGGRPIFIASDVISQGSSSQISTAAGSTLALQAEGNGSITLGQVRNNFQGGVEALSGTQFGQAWNADPAASDVGNPARQSMITLAGQTVLVGGRGLDADLVRISAARLATEPAATPVDPQVAATVARIRTRLWYNNLELGTSKSTPSLQLTLLNPSTGTTLDYGSAQQQIAVNVGAIAGGDDRPGQSGGFVRVLTEAGLGGQPAVFLSGPATGDGGYGFFLDRAVLLPNVTVVYNLVTPGTPQLTGSLSAVASVSDNARKERFEEAVRTENVAIRLRTGIIAEVGPGRPATLGTDGVKPPASCQPAAGALGCE